MMKHLINIAVLWIIALPGCHSNDLHKYRAKEWDVISPENTECETTRGFFGRTAKFDVKMQYKYELTLLEGPYLDAAFALAARNAGSTLRTGGLQGVFSAIETQIADALLESDVFDSVCVGGEIRGPFRKDGGRQLRHSRRELRAVGISSNPEDQILEGLTCRASVNKTDGPCMVVDGEFMIYLDIYEDLDDELNSLLSDLMNKDQRLDDAHPYVQKVRYIDLSADLISGSIEDETMGGQPAGNSATLSSSFYALLAAGAFIVVGTAVFYRRRRNAAEQDGETTTLDQRTAQIPQTPGN